MKRYILAAVVAACLCFCACSNSGNSSNGTQSTADTVENEHIAAAEKLLESWAQCMATGKYSETESMYTEEMWDFSGYSYLEDADYSSEATCEFDEEKSFVTERNGYTTAVVKLTLTVESSSSESYFLVSLVDGEYLISDSAEVSDVEEDPDNFVGYIDKTLSSAAQSAAQTIYESAEDYCTDCGDDLPSDGVYECGDESAVCEYIDSVLAEQFSSSGYSYKVTISDGSVQSAEFTGEFSDRSITGLYPEQE